MKQVTITVDEVFIDQMIKGQMALTGNDGGYAALKQLESVKKSFHETTTPAPQPESQPAE